MKTNVFIGCCLLACVFSACNSRQQKGETQSQKVKNGVQLNSPYLKDTSAVKASVDTIYTTLCDTYNGALDEAQQSEMSSDRRFCTKAWNKTMEDCERERMKRHDQLGCFDYDYWISAQDWDVLSYKIEKVSMQDATHAVVYVVLKNREVKTLFQLWMRKEDGHWRIDDLRSDSEAPSSLMQIARDYIAE